MAYAELTPLHRADGSATYSCNGCSVIAAVNGPMEVQRRDELPEEATVDVTIRPVTGIGGIRERHLESIVQNTLAHAILVSAHARTLIQITLQVLSLQGSGPDPTSIPQAASNLHVLPALLQASIFALLSTSIPLSMTFTATLIAADSNGKLVEQATAAQLREASSIHVFAFSSKGSMLVGESDGDFSIDLWDRAYREAKSICGGRKQYGNGSEDVSMGLEGQTQLETLLKDTTQAKIANEQHWRQGLT